jgi:exodeoxyribonuclease VII large subunit
VLRRVRDGIGQREQRLDDLAYRAETVVLRLARVRRERWMQVDARLKQQHVALRLADDSRALTTLRARLHAARVVSVEAGKLRVRHATTQLEALNPLRVLERGYALVYGPKGTLLRSSDDVQEGEGVVAHLADGRVRATVTAKE